MASLSHGVSSSVQACSPIQPPTLHIPLSEPFAGKTELWLDEIDVIAQETFQNLIEENKKSGLPFYVALTRDEKNAVHFFSASTLFCYESANRDRQLVSPLSRLCIKDSWVYKLDCNAEVFQKVCTFSALRDNCEHFAKIILATYQDLDNVNKAKNRFYAGLQEEKNDKRKDAIKWYSLAADEGSYEACLKLYIMFGESSDTKDKILALKYLQKAHICAPENSEHKSLIQSELLKYDQQPAKQLEQPFHKIDNFT